MTDFWRVRLEGKSFDSIVFRNGYEPDSPLLEVEWLGLEVGEWEGEIVYAIKLGKILRTQWLKKDSRFPPRNCASLQGSPTVAIAS